MGVTTIMEGVTTITEGATTIMKGVTTSRTLQTKYKLFFFSLIELELSARLLASVKSAVYGCGINNLVTASIIKLKLNITFNNRVGKRSDSNY